MLLQRQIMSLQNFWLQMHEKQISTGGLEPLLDTLKSIA
jgi:hypothetical protein